MGDTSSGKSSLLSALSQIELPSSHEITTRCPTRLRMESDPNFSCTVNIIWHDKEKKLETFPVGDSQGITSTISTAQQRILTEEKGEISKSVIEVRVIFSFFLADCLLFLMAGNYTSAR